MYLIMAWPLFTINKDQMGFVAVQLLSIYEPLKDKIEQRLSNS